MKDIETSISGELKPPYGSFAWYEKFFDLIQRQRVDKIDSEFLKLNEIASGVEYKFLKGLRFLDLIKEDGNATEKLGSLRAVGEEFKQNFSKVIKEAYSDLFSSIELDKAKPEDIINYFIRKCDMARATAEQAKVIFVSLVQKTDIPISPELSAKVERPPKPRKPPKERKKEVTELPPPLAPPEGILEIRWGEIRIWLPKEDKKAAIKAKELIESHIKDLEG